MFRRWLDHWLELRRRVVEIADETTLNGRRIEELSRQLERTTRENRLLLGQLTLPEAEHWQTKPHWPDSEPASQALANSAMCRRETFEQPYFSYWTRRLGLGWIYHRKLWEHVFVCQALWERGAIRPGARGLGFGVGCEPLPAYFASEDCEVVATDMAGEDAATMGWSASAQHAASLDTLRFPLVCPEPQFDRRVQFRVCDMNEVPDDLEGFDFCWSACALEHLGSIDAGLRFIERSLDCLKPGGWAIHTTEYNLSSSTETLSEGGTVLFRQRDLLGLEARLNAQGHRFAPFDFDTGSTALDRYLDIPPYKAEPHLKLALEGYAVTSIGLIIQRKLTD
jgi:SAM-dependent methyltransferase